jgi:hypothetical protein
MKPLANIVLRHPAAVHAYFRRAAESHDLPAAPGGDLPLPPMAWQTAVHETPPSGGRDDNHGVVERVSSTRTRMA